MDVVNVILQPIVESLKVHVKKHIVFMTFCKKYVRDMERSMTELKATRVDVENRMEQQQRNKLQTPNHVPGWLEEVEKVNSRVESLGAKSLGTCFSFKTRHGVGKKADELIQEIKHLTEEHSRIVWPTQRIPLGQVDSMKASTSAPSVEYHSDFKSSEQTMKDPLKALEADHKSVDSMKASTSAPSVEYHSDFKSREQTMKDALKALEADHKSHMIALWGMGGVGKTTMMEKMEADVKEKRIFRLIVKVVIGEKTDPFAIQDAVADYLSDIDLKEKTIPARAEKLRGWFKNYSKGGKQKILVILDDIWELVDLNDIGLSPLPNQGVDFKVLLTSRSRDVCKMMGVKADSIFNVKVLTYEEAQRLFKKFIKDSDEADLDPDLHKIGDDIVSKCGGLPIAIKTIAYALKDNSKSVWEDTLTRLQNHDIDEIVNEVFEVSYENLKDKQTRSVLLLCGLYPEDFDIPTEELVRYGWGLKLFNKVNTIGQARNRLNACIGQLVNANLLIESNRAGSIKMHDLVRAFVLNIYSKAEHASIVNHGNMSEWPANDIPDFWKRISLACKDMEEFPRDFKYPNLTFLKLTHGDKSLRFPENFYGLMEKLQVIVYEKMWYPSLPRSFEYSTNLRTLCLHECLLMFDSHSIGSLENLEVLSFANCSIRKLPSTFKNLKKLKILDLTGCVNLRIDEGVLKNLVKLEELYMRVAYEYAIRFTDGNFNELAERSKNLFAIEIEFFRNNAHPKRMSFNKLERFKISIGCFLEKKYEKTTSFENTLMLVSNKGELLEYGINVLFEKTVVLHLEVDGMNDLEDLKCFSFHCLRVLNISKCSQLRYLFTRRVASTLLRLEHLEVWSCDTLQTLIHDEDSGSDPIKFPSLKLLSLGVLPKLACLCYTGSVIELPQLMELRLDGLSDVTSIFPNDNLASLSISSDISTMQPFLNKEVAIPKLETLRIRWMNKLSKIWSSEVAPSENVGFSMLKTIEVEECDRLVDVFPRNPMPLIHHLKQLSVKRCCSIETIFKIDMECVREGSKSSLVSIVVEKSKNLRHVWSLKNVDSSNNRIIHGFEAVESIRISDCGNFRNVSTPITAESRPDQQHHVISRDIAHLTHTFHELRTLSLRYDREAQVVFDVESVSSGELPASQNNYYRLLPSLKDFALIHMDSMSHVWKFNWNQFFILQQPKSLCQNLTKITLKECRSIKYLFSPIMFKFLSNLKSVCVEDCEVMEEIVSNRDDEDEEMATSTSTHTNVTSFPTLETLKLRSLKSLQHIGGGRGSCTSIYNQFQPQEEEEEETVAPRWSLSQYSRHIEIEECSALSSAIPSYALGHMQYLEQLTIWQCDSMKEVFEIKSSCRPGKGSGAGDNNNNSSRCVVSSLTNTMILPDLRNLRRLKIHGCHRLRGVFPFSTLQSLTKLEFLYIGHCDDIRVIVKEDGNHTKPSSSSDDHQVVVFPCLQSMYLFSLPKLESFFLGTNGFQLPVLDKVEINTCPNMRMFTKGHSDSPLLKYVHSDTDLLEQLDVGKKSETETEKKTETEPVKTGFDPNRFDFDPNLRFQTGLGFGTQIPVWDRVGAGSGRFLAVKTGKKPVKTRSTRRSKPVSTRNRFGQNRFLRSLTETGSVSGSGRFGPKPDFVHDYVQPQEAVVPISSLCQYSRHIKIDICHELSSAIPSYALGHMQNLENLEISFCDSMKDVFEIERVVVNDVTSSSSSSCRPAGEGSGAGDNNNNTSSGSCVVSSLTNTTTTTILPDLCNLRTLKIYKCPLLRDVFPFSTLQSLTKLEYLEISCCDDIRVIVKEDGNHTSSSSSSSDHQVVVFPCLKSLKLFSLPKLESFFLGANDFQWPVLDRVEIDECPKMRMFTKGHSDSPMLKYVVSDMGENSVECGLNNLFHEEVPYPSLGGSSSLPISKRMPWFYNNLIKVHVEYRRNQRFIIAHNELQHMQKIEKLRISDCEGVKEIFETFEMNHDLNQTHSVVEEREMDISQLSDIKCLWKSKQWTVLRFPNLTRLSIDYCHGLKHVFTISMVGSLLQLQELHIRECPKMETILADVEKDEDYEKQQDCENGKEDEDDDERRVNEVEFPCLRKLTLRNLRSLKGFCLGIETIHWPSLDTLKIKECPEITTFTNGESTTPKLKLIKTSFGLCDATEGVNSFIRTKIEEGYEFGEVEETDSEFGEVEETDSEFGEVEETDSECSSQ